MREDGKFGTYKGRRVRKKKVHNATILLKIWVTVYNIIKYQEGLCPPDKEPLLQNDSGVRHIERGPL